MKPEDVRNAYLHLGALDNEGKVHTPYVLSESGEKVCFLIRCHVCHKGLCKMMTIGKSARYKITMIFVEPCPRCLAAARKGEEVVPLEMNNSWQVRQEDDTWTP